MRPFNTRQLDTGNYQLCLFEFDLQSYIDEMSKQLTLSVENIIFRDDNLIYNRVMKINRDLKIKKEIELFLFNIDDLIDNSYLTKSILESVQLKISQLITSKNLDFSISVNSTINDFLKTNVCKQQKI
jgi:hypothetical protein